MKLAERWQKIVEQNGVENHEIVRVLSTQIFFFFWKQWICDSDKNPKNANYSTNN